VKEANKLGIKIVSYDWLNDSLLSLTRRPKGEGIYLLKNIVKAAAKKAKVPKTPNKVAKSQAKPKAPKRPIGIFCSYSYSVEIQSANALILTYYS
jgi:hypothetical protein